MIPPRLWSAFLVGAVLSITVAADEGCQSTGIGFSNGGSYLIDVASRGNFSFASQFSGNCTDQTVNPILRDPEGGEYACSAIKTLPLNIQQISTCDIPYSVMTSGNWEIIMQSPFQEWTVVRSFNLTAGIQTTMTVIATPTVTVGYTSTPTPKTVTSTMKETRPFTLAASTIISYCSTGTRTTTAQGSPTTTVISSTAVVYSTAEPTTSQANVTSALKATCSFKVSSAPQPDRTEVPAGGSIACKLVGQPPFVGKGKGGGGRGGGPPPWISSLLTYQGWITVAAAPPPFITWVSCTTKMKRDAMITGRAAEAMAAYTVTQFETSFTQTVTTTSLLPAPTVTRYSINTVTETITPAPRTACTNAPDVTQTVTTPGAKLTRYTILSSTSRVTQTVWVTQTYFTMNMASASACWQEGGSYG